MSSAISDAQAISDLIQSQEKNISDRANRVSTHELSTWTIEEVTGVMVFNRDSPIFRWLQIPVWSMFFIGAGWLVPMQFYAAIHMLAHGRFKPIWKELPAPTVLLFHWSSSMFSFVKASMSMIRESVQRQAALCVNRNGKFAVKTDDYAVLSHVWGETCGWNTPTDWGPVEPEVRKQGIYYEHFLRFFDRCESEWLWVDILAMPEVFDDMSAAQKTDTEDLRTGVINSLRKIYTRADKVVCLDGLLLRLHTGSMIDVAIVLCLGRWIERLWPFTETKLAKRVVLKTEDSSFDLDSIINFLFKNVQNEDHRYFLLFTRLIPLRPAPPGQTHWIRSPLRPNSREPNLFVDIYNGTENRHCDVDIDQARALFPVLDLKWVTGWTLQQGLRHIADSYLEERDILIRYCEYRSIDFTL